MLAKVRATGYCCSTSQIVVNFENSFVDSLPISPYYWKDIAFACCLCLTFGFEVAPLAVAFDYIVRSNSSAAADLVEVSSWNCNPYCTVLDSFVDQQFPLNQFQLYFHTNISAYRLAEHPICSQPFHFPRLHQEQPPD